MVLMEYSGAGGRLIHEKKIRSKKSRDTVSLKQNSVQWSGVYSRWDEVAWEWIVWITIQT